METSQMRKRMPVTALTDPKIVLPAIGSAFAKLDPRAHDQEPGDVRGRGRRRADHGHLHPRPRSPAASISASRSRSSCGCGSRCCSPISPKPWPKAAARRRPRRCARPARRPRPSSSSMRRRGSSCPRRWQARPGQLVLVEAGDIIPSDGEVIEGVASVNEAAITGESAPGHPRSPAATARRSPAARRCVSDWIKVRITAAQGSTFLDRMIALVEGAERQKTPNEIALNILLAGMTIIFVFATATIPSYRRLCRRRDLRRGARGAVRDAHPDDHRRAAVGHRHRRHGPAGALQRARHVGPRSRGGRRRRHAAARQDRHHHARQPAGDRVQAGLAA